MQQTSVPASGAVVKGAASGIGRACAEALAATGRPVALWDLNHGAVCQLASMLGAEHGVAAVGLQVDMADPAAILAAANATREAMGSTGALVHAAVVGIGSINATLGNGLIPAYSASKGGNISSQR